MAASAYVAPAPRGTAAILALYVAIGACLLSVGADVRRIVVAGELRDGRVLVDALLGADQLVLVATLVAAIALVVAGLLCLRWLRVVRANRAVLGEDSSKAPRLMRAWAITVGLAVVAAATTYGLLGDAADVAARQRIDALRIAAATVAVAALALTIALVAAMTAAQEARALQDAAPPAPAGTPDADEPIDGGLRVISEEQARRER